MALFYNISTVSDDPTGIKIMDNPTKTLKGILFPRERISEFDHMDESNQAGVYILYNTADKNEKPQIYIGQTGYNISNRLKDHNRKRDFWNYALVFVEKGDFLNMNSAHTKLIESSLITKATECGIAVMDNSTGSNAPRIQDSDKYAAQTWTEEVIVMTQLLGLYFFVQPHIDEKEKEESVKREAVLHIKKKGFEAYGDLLSASGEFVVYKGSTVSKDPTKSCPKSIREKRVKMAKMLDGNLLTEDMRFSSPSTAAAFVCFASANGWVEWKTADNRSLKEFANGEY